MIVAQPIAHRVVRELATIEHAHAFLMASKPEEPLAVLENGSDSGSIPDLQIRIARPRVLTDRTVRQYFAPVSVPRTLT